MYCHIRKPANVYNQEAENKKTLKSDVYNDYQKSSWKDESVDRLTNASFQFQAVSMSDPEYNKAPV